MKTGPKVKDNKNYPLNVTIVIKKDRFAKYNVNINYTPGSVNESLSITGGHHYG